MAVSVARLGKPLAAQVAGKGQVFTMDSEVVSEVAEFRELKATRLALEDLVHTLSHLVLSVDQKVCALILDLIERTKVEVLVGLHYLLRTRINA